MKKGWAEYLVYQLFRLGTALLRALPLPVVFQLGGIFGRIARVFLPKYRSLAQHNAEIAFGDEEAGRIAFGSFPRMGANFLSSIKLSSMSLEQIREHITGLEVPNTFEAIKEGKGLVILVAHLGNWEVLSQLQALSPGTPVAAVYQKLGNRYIDADVRRMREGKGMRLVERKEGISTLMGTLRAGGIVAVLADQHAGNAGVWAPFFNRLASTSPLAAMLALRSRAPVMTMAALTRGTAKWHLSEGTPERLTGHDIAAATARVNLLVEEMIRQSPEDWFWVHNRWKTPHPRFLLRRYRRGLAGAGLDPAKLKPFRILIRSTNWLGDCVMTLPAVQAIREGRPDAEVTVLCREKLAGFWKRVTCVDRVLSLGNQANVHQAAAEIRAAGNFDAGIVFPNSPRVALELWFAGVPRRVGLPGRFRRFLLNQVITFPVKDPRPHHQSLDYLKIAEKVGAQIPPEIKVAGLVKAVPKEEEHPFRIGVCPGAEYGPAKRWLPERFAEVMREVSARRECEWVLFGVQGDAESAMEIYKRAGENVRNLVGKTTLTELIDNLGSCDLVLTNDSGPMHLAAAIGVPTISLFGSTEPALTGPIGSEHRVIRRHVECSPCFLRECPLDFRCMKAIGVPEVAETILRAMEKNSVAGQIL